MTGSLSKESEDACLLDLEALLLEVVALLLDYVFGQPVPKLAGRRAGIYCRQERLCEIQGEVLAQERLRDRFDKGDRVVVLASLSYVGRITPSCVLIQRRGMELLEPFDAFALDSQDLEGGPQIGVRRPRRERTQKGSNAGDDRPTRTRLGFPLTRLGWSCHDDSNGATSARQLRHRPDYVQERLGEKNGPIGGLTFVSSSRGIGARAHRTETTHGRARSPRAAARRR